MGIVRSALSLLSVVEWSVVSAIS